MLSEILCNKLIQFGINFIPDVYRCTSILHHQQEDCAVKPKKTRSLPSSLLARFGLSVYTLCSLMMWCLVVIELAYWYWNYENERRCLPTDDEDDEGAATACSLAGVNHKGTGGICVEWFDLAPCARRGCSQERTSHTENGNKNQD